MKLKSALVLSLLLLAGLSFAQNTASDSTAVKTDSLNAELLNRLNIRLAENENLRIADSIQKAELEEKLNALKTTDNLQKADLIRQIDALRSREIERRSGTGIIVDSLRKNAKSFPVTGLFNDTLFFIYSKLGSFSAHDRAEAISERIKNLGGKYGFGIDSLQLIRTESTIDIVYRESIIVSITAKDALWNNTTMEELATRYLETIHKALINYRHETTFITLAKEIALALLVLLILGLILRYIGKLFRWISKKIQEQEGKRIKGIKIRNYTLFDAKRQIKVLLTLSTLVKWFIILLCIYIALPIVFNIFPWTQNFAQTLFGYVINPLKKMAGGFWRYLPNLFTIIVIVVVFHYVLKVFYFLKTEIHSGNLRLPGFYPDWANPTYQILRVILYAFSFVLIFPYLPGSDSMVFRGVSVFLGFLFTFGSAGSLSNIIAGLILTYMRLFKIGDRVKIGEVTGDIIEKTLLVTRIRTIKNEIISIPNSTVMNSHTINYSSEADEKGLIMHTTVTIGYDVPWKNMHAALLQAADRTELLLKDPKPFVLQTSLDDFYVSYEINAYTEEANQQATIYSDLHQNIQDCCNEAGIEILSPHYSAARDGNHTTIPVNYLDKNYAAPGFKVIMRVRQEAPEMPVIESGNDTGENSSEKREEHGSENTPSE